MTNFYIWHFYIPPRRPLECPTSEITVSELYTRPRRQLTPPPARGILNFEMLNLAGAGARRKQPPC